MAPSLVTPKKRSAAAVEEQGASVMTKKTTSSSAATESAPPLKKQAKAKPTTTSAPTPTTPSEPAQTDSTSSLTTPITFASLGVCPVLAKACDALNWHTPSEIQRETIPAALAGRDVIGLAETGSGKTAAFVLPMLQALIEKPSPFFGLVLAPTRELAFQISEQVEALGAGVGVKCVVIVGGVDTMAQAVALAKKPHIIVASPGRIVDHLENTKGFSLRSLRYLVLDEADRLLNMDFEKAIDQILQAIPRERRTMLFSATMTSKVAKLQRASLQDPIRIEVSKKFQTAAGLVQHYLFLPAKYKDVYTVYLLNEFAGNSCIVFTSTCEHAQRLTAMLRHLGFSAIPLHGKMAQPKRLGALLSFKAGQQSILVATDVASRGLDIPQVDIVINYDVPTNSKEYVHRVGRTARAGRAGRAMTLVTQYDVELLQRIEALLGYTLQTLPGVEESMVMLLVDRVQEAQRAAVMEIREQNEEEAKKDGGGGGAKSGGGGGAKRGGSGGAKRGGGGGGAKRGGRR